MRPCISPLKSSVVLTSELLKPYLARACGLWRSANCMRMMAGLLSQEDALGGEAPRGHLRCWYQHCLRMNSHPCTITIDVHALAVRVNACIDPLWTTVFLYIIKKHPGFSQNMHACWIRIAVPGSTYSWQHIHTCSSLLLLLVLLLEPQLARLALHNHCTSVCCTAYTVDTWLPCTWLL